MSDVVEEEGGQGDLRRDGNGTRRDEGGSSGGECLCGGVAVDHCGRGGNRALERTSSPFLSEPLNHN